MTNTMVKNTVLTIILCILFCNSIHSIEDPECLETSVCLCKLSDNRYVDISPLKNDHFSVTDRDLTFYFYPCRDFPLNYSDVGVNNTSPSDCSSGSTLCVLNATDKKLSNLGLTTESKFLNEFPKIITFTHGPIITSIMLQCAPDLPVSALVYNVSQGLTNLTLFSSHSCLKLAHPGLSIGSTLLILFATFFGVYLIGGALILHFLRGARGKEVVPNLEFWTSLPGLVKDGTIFVLTGCNPLVVSSAETYDRI